MRLLGTCLILGLLLGCNKRLQKVVNQIDAVQVAEGRSSGAQGTVSLGQLEVPEDDVTASAVNTVANMTLEAFEIELAMRLAGLVDADNLAMNVARAAGTRVEKRGPFPVQADAAWVFDVELVEWGLSADVDAPAAAWTQVYATLLDPSGEWVWRRTLTCTEPLVPDAGSNELAQIATNIGTLRGTDDEVFVKAYRELSRSCARDIVDRLRTAVDKAKAKAARAG